MDHRPREKLATRLEAIAVNLGMMVGVRTKERRHHSLDSGAIFKVEPTGFGWNVGFERTRRVGAVLKSFEVFFGYPLCLKCH